MDYVSLAWCSIVEVLDEHEGSITAIATIVIAVFTVALALSTRKLGKMAVEQDERMHESILVSKNAMKLSEAALIASERAFVFPTGSLQGFWERNVETNTYNWRFRIEWRNSGDTPTKNMTMHIESSLKDNVLPNGFDFKYPTTKIGKGLIPPNTTGLSGITPQPPEPAITPEDILEVQAGRKWLYIYGWAKYFDVFPGTPERITRFCWFITPIGNPLTYKPDSQIKEEQLGFPSIHHSEGNCADNECNQLVV